MGQNNTLIGYFQQGRKQKPKRGLSTLLPPESVRAQDSCSRMYKGEYQRVVSDRTFFSVERRELHAGLADGGAGRSGNAATAALPVDQRGGGCRMDCVQHLSQEAAAEDAVDALPAQQGRQSRLQVRVRGCSRTRIATVTTGAPGRSATRMPALTRASRRIEFGSSTLATPRAMALTGPWAPRRIGTMPASPRIAGRRTRTSRSRSACGWTTRRSATATLSGSRSSPTPHGPHLSGARRTSPPTTLVKNTNVAPRLGLTYDLTGKGRTVLKAFYGRYYNNIADSFTGATLRVTRSRIQLPRPEPQRPLRRAVGARHGAPAIRRQLDGGRSRLQDSLDRGDQRVVRDPAAG